MKTENIVFLDRSADPYLTPIATKRENDVTTVVFDFTDNVEAVLLETAAPLLSVFNGPELIEETGEFEQLEPNKYSFIINKQITDAPGSLMASIKFVGTGGEIWASENFCFYVADRVDGDGQAIARANPSVIEQMKAAAETVIQNLSSITENRQGAEEARVQAAGFAGDSEESASTATEQAGIATTQAGISTAGANSAAISKDITNENKAATEQLKQIAEQKATESTEQALLSEYYANQVISAVSSMPMRYYRPTEQSMETITNPKQGDLCYVTDFANSKTKLFVYDTTDMDADNNNPEWVFLGILEFANLDRTTLLGILQLATVATSGSYNDLLDKPNRYESWIVLTGDTWNYTLSDKAIITIAQNTAVEITGVYNGAVGFIKVYGGYELILPSNSEKAIDMPWVTAGAGQFYEYSFDYDGTNFCWARMVYE